MSLFTNCTCGQCTSEIRVCTQVNIPTVDNTAPNCADAFYEECVIMTEARTNPIDIAVNDNLKDTINALLLHIITLQDRILVLENYNIANP